LFAATSGLAFVVAPAMAQETPDQSILSEDSRDCAETCAATGGRADGRLGLPAEELLNRKPAENRDYFYSVPACPSAACQRSITTSPFAASQPGVSTSPTVGVTIDDVPYGSVSILGFGSRFFLTSNPSDLQRIEVLRGRRATLYGASSLGGLLKYVTTDPSPSEFLAGSRRRQPDQSRRSGWRHPRRSQHSLDFGPARHPHQRSVSARRRILSMIPARGARMSTGRTSMAAASRCFGISRRGAQLKLAANQPARAG